MSRFHPLVTLVPALVILPQVALGQFSGQDLTRQIEAASQAGKPTLRLKGGTYRLTQPLRIESKQPLTIEPRPGEQVIVKGSQRISNWKRLPNGTWAAPLPKGTRPEQLFVAGQRWPRPSFPAQGHFFITRGIGERDRFYTDPNLLPKNWSSWQGVEAVITHLWGISRIPIRSVDLKTGLVILEGETWHDQMAALAAGTWFRLENTPPETLRPGQWRLSTKGDQILLNTKGLDPNRAEVEIPLIPTLLEVQGAKNLTLRNLTFAQSSFQLPAKGRSWYQAESDLGGIVEINQSSEVVLDSCLFANTGGYGLAVKEGSEKITIQNSQFSDLGAGGIRIGQMEIYGENDPRYPRFVEVKNCLIESGGRIHPSGIGVLVLQAQDCTIRNNTITDFTYSGISVGWKWGAGFSPAQRNLILNNLITNIGQGVLSDLAGIYTLGESPGTVIRGNTITGIRRARYGGWGIYFDEGSRHILAEENTVWDTEDSPFHIHYGGDNIVRRNLFAYGQNAQMQFSNNAKIGPMLIENNVFLWKTGRLFASEPGPQVVFKGNTYWREQEPTAITFIQGQSVSEWRKREPDARITKPQAQLTQNPKPRLANSRFLGKIPSTFPPAPPIPRVAFNEDLEPYRLGKSLSGWGEATANTETKVVVTDEAARGGKHSLKFLKSAEGASYMPHIWLEPKYEKGRVETSFWAKVMPGGNLTFEWRDTDPWYTSGLAIALSGSGEVKVGEASAAQFPAGSWIQVQITHTLGQSTAELKLSAEGQAPKSIPITLPTAFRKLSWVGFMSVGAPGSIAYLDDLKVQNTP